MRVVSCIGALWLACAASADDAATAADEPVLRFAWHLPGGAAVEETASRQGDITIVRYRIDAQPHPDGDIIVEQSDMQLLQFNGEDPKLALGVMYGPVLAMASNVPAMRIDREGQFVDVVDLGKTIDRMVELLVQDLTVLEPAMVRDMIVAARTPTVMQLTVDATRSRWNNWVGHWAGMPLKSQGWSYHEPQNNLDGMKTLRSSALVEHLGAASETGHTRMRLTTIWEGAIDHADQRMLPASDRSPASDDVSMQISNTVDATVDTATLRPLIVTTTTETTVHSGEQSQVDTQSHEYRFTWADRLATGTSH